MFDHTTRILDERYFQRVEAMASGWEDEAAEASIGKQPKQAWYLEHMAKRARDIAGHKLGEAKQRIAIERSRR